MRTGFLKIALFVLVTASPIFALTLGVVAPYGQTDEHPKFPKLVRLLEGHDKAFDKLGEAILHRSTVTAEVIRLRNLIGYQKMHFIDVDSVISGKDGWLFYKGDFKACFDAADTSEALAQIDVMTDIAQASGLNMIVSLSPDKSVIYPEYLHPAARFYWNCKAGAHQILEDRIKVDAPRIVDHASVLLAEKVIHPDQKLYYETDTHWTPYAAALALRQLLAVLSPGQSTATMPPPSLTGKLAKRNTDMSRMLMMPVEDTAAQIDPNTEAKLVAFDSAAAHLQTVVLRDSFYEVLEGEFTNLFHYKVFHIEREIDKYPQAIATADRLIINSVERAFINRIRRNNDVMSWGQPLANALILRNMKYAEKCTAFAPIEGTPTPKGQLEFPVPARDDAANLCVRLTLDTPVDTQIEVSLPARQPDGSVFEAGRSIPFPVAAGTQVINFVIPGYVRGKSFRVGLSDDRAFGAKLRLVEIGHPGNL